MHTPEPGLHLESGLRDELSDTYGRRALDVLQALGRMGPRFYYRLNTLRGNRESLFDDLVMEKQLSETRLDEIVKDAAYLPTSEKRIEARGRMVEADKYAAEAILHGAHLYGPGVRKCQGLVAGEEASVVTMDGQLAGTGLARQGEQMILKYHTGIAVQITESRYGVPSLMDTASFEKGLFHLQSLPAMVTCQVLDPQPGETIIDLNCAPGGKLSYICQLTENKSRMIGFDRNQKKLDRTRKHLERLGCSNYQLIPHDSRYVHEDFTFSADRVIVDPPCTGLGVVPKLGVDVTNEDVENLSDYQRQFLTAAFHIVHEGGVIVYSVCTITTKECEGILDHATKLGLVLDEATPMIGGKGLDERGLTQRFDPDLHGTGYFIAKFLKP